MSDSYERLMQVSGEKEFFANLVVDAVSKLDPQTLDLRMIGIKKVGKTLPLTLTCRAEGALGVCDVLICGTRLCRIAGQRKLCRGSSCIRPHTRCRCKQVQGGGLRDSFLVDGVAFKKTFSYAGFEMQPRSFDQPRVLSLNIELELKSEKENAEVRRADPEHALLSWKVRMPSCVHYHWVLDFLVVLHLWFQVHTMHLAGRMLTKISHEHADPTRRPSKISVDCGC